MYFPGKRIKEGYDGSIYKPQVTVKPDNTKDIISDVMLASVKSLKERGLF